MRLYLFIVIFILLGCVFWLRIRMQINRGLNTEWYKITGIAKTKPDDWLFTVLRATKDDPDTMWYTLLRQMEGSTAIPYEPSGVSTLDTPRWNTTTGTATTPASANEAVDQRVADATATAEGVLGIKPSGTGTSRVECTEGEQTQYMKDNNIKVMNCYATAPAP